MSFLFLPRNQHQLCSLLFTCEPANFATVDILRSRYVEQIVQRYVEESDGTKTFNDKTAAQIMEQLVSIFAHLFGVVKLPKWHAEYLKANAAAKGPCSVILEPIDGKIKEILEVHSKHAIEVMSKQPQFHKPQTTVCEIVLLPPQPAPFPYACTKRPNPPKYETPKPQPSTLNLEPSIFDLGVHRVLALLLPRLRQGAGRRLHAAFHRMLMARARIIHIRPVRGALRRSRRPLPLCVPQRPRRHWRRL